MTEARDGAQGSAVSGGRPCAGLLGLYLELYDRVLPAARERIDRFYETIASELEARGLRVVRAPVCRLEPEFREALALFEREGAHAVVTLHLAYSPSLESAGALAATRLPLIVLDTTPARDYGPSQDPDELMYNHGIHGVQDLCNVLIRRGREFFIEAGHWSTSNVLDRVAGRVRGAVMASRMRSARVGTLGSPFRGMGDFQVSPDVLREALGVTVVAAEFGELQALVPPAEDAGVRREMDADRGRFETEGPDAQVHEATVRASLAVRRWLEEERLTAFTMNFDEFRRTCGLPTIPFLEASKSMSRGIGYAGEGDVLTAAFVGAVASVLPDTTFTEMFCPDWEGGRVFLSHMAEMNPDLSAGKARLVAKEMPWIDAATPAVAVGRFRSGRAVFSDLAPGPEGSFTLILAPVEVDGGEPDRMEGSIRGWLRPAVALERFLERYSELGGTHHAALTYGDALPALEAFGRVMGWRVEVIGSP